MSSSSDNVDNDLNLLGHPLELITLQQYVSTNSGNPTSSRIPSWIADLQSMMETTVGDQLEFPWYHQNPPRQSRAPHMMVGSAAVDQNASSISTTPAVSNVVPKTIWERIWSLFTISNARATLLYILKCLFVFGSIAMIVVFLGSDDPSEQPHSPSSLSPSPTPTPPLPPSSSVSPPPIPLPQPYWHVPSKSQSNLHLLFLLLKHTIQTMNISIIAGDLMQYPRFHLKARDAKYIEHCLKKFKDLLAQYSMAFNEIGEAINMEFNATASALYCTKLKDVRLKLALGLFRQRECSQEFRGFHPHHHPQDHSDGQIRARNFLTELTNHEFVFAEFCRSLSEDIMNKDC